MPKDQFYHDNRKQRYHNTYDKRGQIMTGWRQEIIKNAHQIGYAQFKYNNDKYKIGVPIFDKMREIGKLLPTRTLLEQLDQTIASSTFVWKSQTEFAKLIKELNNKLAGPKQRPWESLGKLSKEEAEELQHLASKAFTEGAAGYKLKEPLVDSIQNGNFGEEYGLLDMPHHHKLPSDLIFEEQE